MPLLLALKALTLQQPKFKRRVQKSKAVAYVECAGDDVAVTSSLASSGGAREA